MSPFGILLIAACVFVMVWSVRSELDERLYDGVPKPIISMVNQINGDITPPGMQAAIDKWLPKGERFAVEAEAYPIFHDDTNEPLWSVRIIAKGVSDNSVHDALFNRYGEKLS